MPVVTPHDPTLFQIGHKTDAGRSGKNNEDDYGLFATRYPQGGASVQVAVVADGIGGHAGGEWASYITVETMRAVMLDREDISVPQRLEEAIRQANSAIYRRSLEEPNLAGMGTTVVAAAILQKTLYVAHLGDSRAYLIRDGRAHRLTVDHSWAQEAVDAGRLSVEAAKVHPNRHVIKRFLGIDADIEVDHGMVALEEGNGSNGEVLAQAQRVSQTPIQPGDAILLCSDGLTDVVSDKEIARVVSRRAPQDAAERLVDLANKAGGPDNITAVILKRESETQAAGGGSRTPLLALLIGLLALALVAGGWFLLAGRGGAEKDRISQDMIATQVAAAFTATAGAAPPTATEASTNTATPTATETPRPETPTPEDALPEQAGEGTPAAALVQATNPNSGENAIAESDTLSATTPLSQTSCLNPASEAPAPASEEGITTSTPRPTKTPRATSTPVPRRADLEATATAKADEATAVAATKTAAAPTSTPRPITRTAPSPAATRPTAVLPSGTVTLIGPAEDDSLDGNSKQEFSWSALPSLPNGVQYELVFWKPEEDGLTAGRSPVGASLRTAVPVDLNAADTQMGDIVDPGKTTCWGVRLWNSNPGRALEMVSDGCRKFVYTGTGGGSSSSGGGGGDDDGSLSGSRP